MNSAKILADLVASNPAFFEEYEQLAQNFYKVLDSVTAIPEAHVKALLATLEYHGYEVRKKPQITEVNNVLQLKRNV